MWRWSIQLWWVTCSSQSIGTAGRQLLLRICQCSARKWFSWITDPVAASGQNCIQSVKVEEAPFLPCYLHYPLQWLLWSSQVAEPFPLLQNLSLSPSGASWARELGCPDWLRLLGGQDRVKRYRNWVLGSYGKEVRDQTGAKVWNSREKINPWPYVRIHTHWQLLRKWNFPETFDTDFFLHGGLASLDKQRDELTGNLCPLFV